MPCGQLDKRRGGHRCAPCQRSHLRCDGLSPCLNCQTRHVACILPRRTTQLQVVNVSPGPRKALTLSSWRYVGFFFQAAGILPQSAVLRCEQVISLSHSDEGVAKALSTVGQLYAARMGLDMPDGQQRGPFGGSLSADKNLCTQRMKRSLGMSSSACLLSALILGVADLLLDDTSDSWRSWMATVSDYIDKTVIKSSTLSALDKDLIRLSQLNDVLGSLSRSERPLGLDFSASLLKEDMTRPARQQAPRYDSFTKIYNCLLSILWRWSQLQEKLTWCLSDGIDYHYHYQDSDDTVCGLDLISEASRLQLDVLPFILDAPNLSESTYRSLLPYFRWVLLGTSQLVQESYLWQVGCKLPILPQDCVYGQCVAMLNDIEELVRGSTLDIAFFLPLVETLGIRLLAKEDQVRIVKFLDEVESRGFGVAKAYR